MLLQSYRIALDAYRRFNANDGWAIASHIALSTLMSLFPFLILVTAIAGFIGSKELADEVAKILIEAWPAEVATPIATEMHSVLTTARGDLLTIGVVLAIYFSSSGLRACASGSTVPTTAPKPRSWWQLQLESIGYVLISAVSLLALALLVVLGPLHLCDGGAIRQLARAVLAADQFPAHRGCLDRADRCALACAQMAAGGTPPAWRDRAGRSVATLVLWLVAGEVFGRYLADFAYTYVTVLRGACLGDDRAHVSLSRRRRSSSMAAN